MLGRQGQRPGADVVEVVGELQVSALRAGSANCASDVLSRTSTVMSCRRTHTTIHFRGYQEQVICEALVVFNREAVAVDVARPHGPEPRGGVEQVVAVGAGPGLATVPLRVSTISFCPAVRVPFHFSVSPVEEVGHEVVAGTGHLPHRVRRGVTGVGQLDLADRLRGGDLHGHEVGQERCACDRRRRSYRTCCLGAGEVRVAGPKRDARSGTRSSRSCRSP
jgi:hypothetical protein